MLTNKFLLSLNNFKRDNALLKFVVVVLAIGFVWNTYEVNQSKDRIRTVIVPPGLNSKVEISGSWTSDAYAKEYVRYIGSLIWNYSPGVARNQFNELLLSWHPDVFEDARQRLYILADQIEKTNAASVFYISKFIHDSDKKTIEVTGNRRLTQHDQQVENIVKTYVITYKVDNARFWITSIEEKVEGRPAPSTKPQPQPIRPK